MKSALGWKVPFRQVYCDTFGVWLRETTWCLFVLKVFPFAVDFESDSLLVQEISDPDLFHQQYSPMLKRALRGRRTASHLRLGGQ